MPLPLREGIYEHLLTTVLEQRVADASPARAEVVAVERADLPALLARHLRSPPRARGRIP